MRTSKKQAAVKQRYIKKAKLANRKSSFLFPAQIPFQRSSSDPLTARLLAAIGRKVRIPITFSGEKKGGVSSAGDLVAKLPANLRVSFVLRQMENEIVAGGGVANCRATWETHSPDATIERQGGGPFTLPAPGPGEIWDIPHANGIYDALVHNGCGNTPVFRVELHSTILEGDLFSEMPIVGEFLGVDNTTIQPNGFWTFSYTIRAHGTNGGVSDLKFRGTVSATCTNIVNF